MVPVDTIWTLIDVSFVLLTSRSRRERYPGYVCHVSKAEVTWYVFLCSLLDDRQRFILELDYVLTRHTFDRLAMVACRQVLVRKQTGYREVIAWLEEEIRKLSSSKELDVKVLVGVAKSQLVPH